MVTRTRALTFIHTLHVMLRTGIETGTGNEQLPFSMWKGKYCETFIWWWQKKNCHKWCTLYAIMITIDSFPFPISSTLFFLCFFPIISFWDSIQHCHFHFVSIAIWFHLIHTSWRVVVVFLSLHSTSCSQSYRWITFVYVQKRKRRRKSSASTP